MFVGLQSGFMAPRFPAGDKVETPVPKTESEVEMGCDLPGFSFRNCEEKMRFGHQILRHTYWGSFLKHQSIISKLEG